MKTLYSVLLKSKDMTTQMLFPSQELAKFFYAAAQALPKKMLDQIEFITDRKHLLETEDEITNTILDAVNHINQKK